jgi:hypothetical protein
MGCTNNGYSLSLPKTCDALYRKPSYYSSVLQWVEQQNETVYKNKDAEFQFNVTELKNRYHKVWRDAFAPGLREMLHGAYSLTNKVILEVTNLNSVDHVVSKEFTDTSIT